WRRSVDPDTLGPYLARARAALLIREASGTNAAAAPTKAFQYLTAGIAVVTTPHPPAVAELCRQLGRGGRRGVEHELARELRRPRPVDRRLGGAAARAR